MDSRNKDGQRLVEAKLEAYQYLHNLLLSQLRQSAKVDWSSEGDRNTNFYQAIIKSRRKANKIYSLYDDAGQLVKTTNGLRDHIVTFYKTIVGQAMLRECTNACVFDVGPKITEEADQLLIVDVTHREIKVVL